MACKRVLVIGAGPSGCSCIIQFQNVQKSGCPVPEVVCYEKQDNCGGLWNFTWRTGLDEFGEKVHCSTYRHLWSNGPKECIEYGDYTFDEHFGRPVPSFPPRLALISYLQGRFKKFHVRDKIGFQQSVQMVRYNDDTRRFTVTVKDLPADKSRDEEFDYVINCSGHFSTPCVPDIPGIEQFPGRVIHAHDFRDANQFSGQRLLIVGGSYSAEDMAQQTLKFGAKHVTISYRSRAQGFNWPDGIEERPLVVGMDGRVVTFKDGCKAEVDSIIIATGYQFDNWFLSDNLRLNGANLLYPQNCYKGIIWQPSANDQLFHIGFVDQYYTYTLFDVQAHYAVSVITGKVPLPPWEEMDSDWRKWKVRCNELKDCHEEIDFQTEYLEDLRKMSDYPYKIDISSLYHVWEDHRREDIATYREKCFSSIHTGTMSPRHHTKWYKAMDESLKDFLR